MTLTADFVVIGAGAVGVTTAREIKRRSPAARVVVLEKEARHGLHSSGRNSGVLHSGIYYPAGSLKARLCNAGALELRRFCEDRGLPVSALGKILVATRDEDVGQLDMLAERGAGNGVATRHLDAAELARLEPAVRAAGGRALLVPMTAVIDSGRVLDAMVDDARNAGVEFVTGGAVTAVDPVANSLATPAGPVSYGMAINAAGLHADTVAHRFGVGRDYRLLPFKGIYWKLDPRSRVRVSHLIYPVPDLRVPFLGVHTTTAINGTTYLGPTAIPAFGRENYRGLRGATPGEGMRIARDLAAQYFAGRDGFRRLAWQEGRRALKPFFAQAARALLPALATNDLLACDKVGLRAQMLDRRSGALVNDFVVENGPASVHVLNAISPAFTSSMPFARYICDNHIFATGTA